ncbi:MAG: nucleotidyl transferase AbiEii/AbiGii toxin family protein, partial [Patescibacteria group bacterium]|nr:nucleotidyl transferase AbiEii/AbiGii toxin family protein [Patescibacteria group bacterium]
MFEKGVSQQTRRNLAILSRLDFVRHYFLAGGTACALYLGHRLSFDLDWFSEHPVEPRIIVSKLKNLGKLEVLQNDEGTFNGSFNQIKLSFFIYPYPLLFPLHEFEGIKIADIKDIACMKLDAISRRGTKRDFIDLYFICKNYRLDYLLELYEQKFAKYNAPVWHVVKSLSYFVAAENDDLPEMLQSVEWNHVKHFFEGEA